MENTQEYIKALEEHITRVEGVTTVKAIQDSLKPIDYFYGGNTSSRLDTQINNVIERVNRGEPATKQDVRLLVRVLSTLDDGDFAEADEDL